MSVMSPFFALLDNSLSLFLNRNSTLRLSYCDISPTSTVLVPCNTSLAEATRTQINTDSKPIQIIFTPEQICFKANPSYNYKKTETLISA
jgi:hypothetical protein